MIRLLIPVLVTKRSFDFQKHIAYDISQKIIIHVMCTIDFYEILYAIFFKNASQKCIQVFAI